jgi:hypothetical protein
MAKTTKKLPKAKAIILDESILETPIEQDPNITNVNNCEYRLTLNFNGQVFDCYTNNLKVSLMSYKPKDVLTEGYIRIQKGEAVWEKKYPLVKLRQIFIDEQSIDLLLATILF